VDKSSKARVSIARRRPNFAVEFKRQLVEQTLQPGASVALIARENEVNANLLFKWRRHYLKGAFGAPIEFTAPPTNAPAESASFLPVALSAELSAPAVTTTEPAASVENVCEVEFDRARLRIRGDVSPVTLKLLIRELSR
jgi:transposase